MVFKMWIFSSISWRPHSDLNICKTKNICLLILSVWCIHTTVRGHFSLALSLFSLFLSLSLSLSLCLSLCLPCQLLRSFGLFVLVFGTFQLKIEAYIMHDLRVRERTIRVYSLWFCLSFCHPRSYSIVKLISILYCNCLCISLQEMMHFYCFLIILLLFQP